MKKGGMDRNAWLAAGACLLLLVLYPKIVAHYYPPAPAKTPTTQTAPSSAAPLPPVAPSLTSKETLAPGSIHRSGTEQTAFLENSTLRVTFTTWGGGIQEIELVGHAGDPGEKIHLNRGSPDAIFDLRGWTPAGEGLIWTLEKSDPQEVVFRPRPPPI